MNKAKLLLLTPLVVGLAACGSSGPKGFNDPNKLAANVQVAGNERLQQQHLNGEVTNVVCVNQAKHIFICHIDASDGSTTTVTVTVSADGSNWVSGAAS